MVFTYCNYRLPFTRFLIDVLMFHQMHLSQMKPFGLAKVNHFDLSCLLLARTRIWMNKNAMCFSLITTSMKDWKDRFSLVDDRCVPTEMTWRLRRSTLPGPLPKGFVALRLKSFEAPKFEIRATKTK
ncbi:hypothetical protein Hanom_Chr05g00423521 [Helianthus anomalus]